MTLSQSGVQNQGVGRAGPPEAPESGPLLPSSSAGGLAVLGFTETESPKFCLHFSWAFSRRVCIQTCRLLKTPAPGLASPPVWPRLNVIASAETLVPNEVWLTDAGLRLDCLLGGSSQYEAHRGRLRTEPSSAGRASDPPLQPGLAPGVFLSVLVQAGLPGSPPTGALLVRGGAS